MTSLAERWLQLSTIARWWAAGQRIDPSRIDRGALTTRWYHDFAPLGLPTPQLPGIYAPNQASKQATLFRYVSRAVAELPSDAEGSVIEYFCADGFYAIHARRAGASRVLGVDIDQDAIRKARLITDVLGIDKVAFQVRDVFDVEVSCDISICAGGLYHIADPEALLRRLRARTRHALVVQTVIHDANDDPGYFETPAPGWTWGSRFSLAYLLSMADRAGWRVMEWERGILAGNARVEDRGTAFLLCEPATHSRLITGRE